MDQMLHVLSICKSLKLVTEKYENIRVLEDNLGDSGSVKIKFEINAIEVNVSLSRFSNERERRVSLNDGEAELRFSRKPFIYKNNILIREISDSGRLFPIAQTLSNFLFHKETELNMPLSLKSLMPEIELCFICEDIFVKQMSNQISSKRDLIFSEDSLSPQLVYFLGILYYRFISGSPNLSDKQYLKGKRGVKELISWGMQHTNIANDRPF